MKIDPSRLPVEQTGRTGSQAPVSRSQDSDATGIKFGKVLRESVTGLKFSAHAEERIASRGIDISVAQLERLKGAVDRIAAKGGRESLVLVDDKAFLVSVKNRTVVTALAGPNVREGVFTNIDSAAVS
ncbi:MAG: TIGR02530 family flagellar biosynthesis protein [Candidatus Hydrogenedentota bacterium]